MQESSRNIIHIIKRKVSLVNLDLMRNGWKRLILEMKHESLSFREELSKQNVFSKFHITKRTIKGFGQIFGSSESFLSSVRGRNY